jgi:hypothetical protein
MAASKLKQTLFDMILAVERPLCGAYTGRVLSATSRRQGRSPVLSSLKKGNMKNKITKTLLFLMMALPLLYTNSSWALSKGALTRDELDYLDNTFTPILIKAHICTEVHKDCDGKPGEPGYVYCDSEETLSCSVYGITDEKVINELFMSMLNSGLNVSSWTFYRSKYHESTFFEKPLLKYENNTFKSNVPISQRIPEILMSLFFGSILVIPFLFLTLGPAFLILSSDREFSKEKIKWFLYSLATVTIVPFLVVCLMEAVIDDKPRLSTFEWTITPLLMLSGWFVHNLYKKR